MTKLERIALAIAKADPSQSGNFDEGEMGEYFQEKYREHYLPMARAAIEEMFEPTDLMGNGLPADYRPGSHSATQIWKALIKSILTEMDHDKFGRR